MRGAALCQAGTGMAMAMPPHRALRQGLAGSTFFLRQPIQHAFQPKAQRSNAGSSRRRCLLPARAFLEGVEGAEAAATFLTAAAAAASAQPIVQATGVPLLNKLMALSLREALVKGTQVLVLTAVGAVALDAFLRFLEWKSTQPSKAPGLLGPLADSSGQLRPVPLLLGAVIRQAKRLLPWCAGAFMATVVLAMLQVTAVGMPENVSKFLGSSASDVLGLLRNLTQFMEDAAEEAVILFIGFTLLDAKQRVAEHWVSKLVGDADTTNDGAISLVTGASKVLSVAIWAEVAVVTLGNYGINMKPLVTALGASSIVLGLAAQSLVKNLAAGITLYATRPYSVGESVSLLSVGGDVVVEGTVVALLPLRTVIRGPTGSTFFINNGDIEGMIVENKRTQVSSVSSLASIDSSDGGTATV